MRRFARGAFDLDGDGAVNLRDFIQFARNFGKRAGESRIPIRNSPQQDEWGAE